ncbi:MAG TPA: DUF2520 domain-containing protein [Syntrophales bacterium]|jgi:predicted short-subunit dehydrogenase-like oxidoreductase (DUF2520 family)|nr:DUF2520 domain-containing protein [Syntrophales bacterium]
METFAIIGLGKVGSSIGCLLKQAGYNIVAVVDQSEETLRKNIVYTGGKPFSNPSEIDVDAACFIITTGDDQIQKACEELSPHLKADSVVIHMSGAGGLDLLQPARRAGAKTGSIHPLQTFSDIETAIGSLAGTVYGITVDPDLENWANRLVRAIGGVPFFVDNRDRALYHAAACIVSNYFVSLMYMAEEIYRILGLDAKEARRAFWPLLMGTLHNIEQKGSVPSLTGPIARGDLGTLEKHLEAIRAQMPSLLSVYGELGKITADVALKKNSLSAEQVAAIKSLLSKGARP